MKYTQPSVEQAETIAISAIGFLAADDERIGRFLALSGLEPGDLASHITERPFLVGVLDHLMSDETLLFLFCENAGLNPQDPAAARRRLDET